VKDKNILIYIDGAAFHTGGRLRRDRAIRQALINGGTRWKVVELSAKDLANVQTVIRRLSGP
jgi:hypothetical protein